jgi:hypothetical protein
MKTESSLAPGIPTRFNIKYLSEEICRITNGRYERHFFLSRYWWESLDWPIAVNVLEELEEQGIQDIWYIAWDWDFIFKTTVAQFQEFGDENYIWKGLEEEPQVWLPREFWEREYVPRITQE